jgi:uncharacterized damage-inducible protein DinB
VEDQLVETWLIHDRINHYLLDAISDDALCASIGAKNRTVYQLFAHIHNVRLMWLKPAAPELLGDLPKLDGKSIDRQALIDALEGSGKAIAELIRKSAAAGGKVKGFKPHLTAFVGYLISHESHHRGQIGWTLKNSGHPLSQKIAFGLWEWGVR